MAWRVCYNHSGRGVPLTQNEIDAGEVMDMKKWLALLMAACLMAGCASAFAEADAALPEPDEVVAAAASADADEAEGEDAGELGELEDAPADPDEPFLLWFEEGFGLTLPAGWVSYPVDEADVEKGLRYILGDGEGACYLYIQAQSAAGMDIEAVSGLIEKDAEKEKTGDLTFGGQPFQAFIDSARDLSGCSTVLNGELLSFLFKPQSDTAYMMTATGIMESFTIMK